MDIKFRVAGQKLMMLTKYNKFVSDAKDFMYLIFDLPREWSGYTVTAEFVQDGKIISKSLNQGNGVYLPNELSAGICLLALRGTNSGSIVTTDSIALYIDKYVGSDRSGGSGDSYITVELAEPTISVDQNGVVTATVNQEEGYVVKSSKQSSLRLPTHSGGSIVPEKNNKVAVQSGMYTTGDVIISGDKNLDPSNIRKGATIFNVSGEYEGSVGVDLPTINNPAYDEHVFADKEYINADGLKRSGSFTIDDELTEQDSLILQISDALRNKAAGSGSFTLPELTNMGTADDMAIGKELINGDGIKVTGKVPDITSTFMHNATKVYETNNLNGESCVGVRTDMPSNYLMRKGSNFLSYVEFPEFGNAEPEDVADGVYFTSKAGFLAKGRHVCNGGMTLPDLGDTAAQPTDIAAGKVLYDDEGTPVTGELEELSVLALSADNISIGQVPDSDYIYCIAKSNKDCIVRSGTSIKINPKLNNFGDATPDKVAKGVTFTSKAGLAIPGAMEAASGGGLVVKKGNTSSPTIETGLSSIDYFVLMTTGFTRAGLMQMLYRKPNNAISYILCTSYSYSTMKTELNHANMTSSTLFTVDGGTVTWNGTGTSAFMSGESYMWLAFGA